MDQDVAESNDAAVLADPRGKLPVELGELSQRLADNFEFTLHGGAQHGFPCIVGKLLAGCELSEQGYGLLDVEKILLGLKLHIAGPWSFLRIPGSMGF